MNTLNSRYGSFPSKQIQEYKQSLHSAVHWLLLYKERNYEELDSYFDSLLFRIYGYNELFNYPKEVISLLSILEAARAESLNPDCNFAKYRKAILDAHSLIDKIRTED